MKELKPSVGDKAVLGMQIFLLVCFYLFASGVGAFLGYAVYRSITNHDHPAHALILSSIIGFAFSILTSVMTMVFTVIIREGQKNKAESGGPRHEI